MTKRGTRTYMRSFFPIALLLSLSAVACSDDDETEIDDGEVNTAATPATCGEPAERFVVREGAVDHTCGHVNGGPFGDLTAAAMDAEDPPWLENQHMFYTVEMPEAGEGSLTVRFPFNGTFVVNVSDDVPVDMVALDDGSETCNAANQILDGCDGLNSAHLFTVEARRPYRLVIGPTDLESVGIVVEEHIIVAE